MDENQRPKKDWWSIGLPIFFSITISAATFWNTAYLQTPRAAAADYSRFYLTNAEFAKSYLRLVSAAFGPPNFIDPAEKLNTRSFLDYLDNVSYLVNRSYLDNEFVAYRIKCDIKYIYEKILPRVGDEYGSANNLKKYYKMHRATCTDTR